MTDHRPDDDVARFLAFIGLICVVVIAATVAVMALIVLKATGALP